MTGVDILRNANQGIELVIQQERQGFFVSVIWVRASVCTAIIPAVSYLPTGLAGCSVSPRISYVARKLARTPRVKKKKIANQVTWTAVMAQSREPKRGRTEVHSLSPRK